MQVVHIFPGFRLCNTLFTVCMCVPEMTIDWYNQLSALLNRHLTSESGCPLGILEGEVKSKLCCIIAMWIKYLWIHYEIQHGHDLGSNKCLERWLIWRVKCSVSCFHQMILWLLSFTRVNSEFNRHCRTLCRESLEGVTETLRAPCIDRHSNCFSCRNMSTCLVSKC